MDIDGTSADDKDGPKVLIDLVRTYPLQINLKFDFRSKIEKKTQMILSYDCSPLYQMRKPR
jgi:hypothetical protein